MSSSSSVQISNGGSDLSKVITSLRALAQTSKHPTPLTELLEEYRDFEGYSIDPKDYGYDSVMEILHTSGKFAISYEKGEIYVAARRNKNTEHITKMVRRQKSSSGGGRNRSHKFYTPKKSHSRSLISETLFSSNWHSSVNTNSITNSSYLAPPPPSYTPPPLPLLTPPPPPTFPLFNDNSSFLRSMADSGIFPMPSNPNYRPLPDVVPESTYTSFLQNIPEPILNYRDVESIVALEIYCSLLGMKPPCYEIYQLDSFRGFFCMVFVGDRRYSTEPDAYDTPLRAKVECAAIAKLEIYSAIVLPNIPLANFRNRTIARKLYRELLKYPAGVSCKSIPALFQYACGQMLPSHWMNIIKVSSKFILNLTNLGDVIVFANLSPQ